MRKTGISVILSLAFAGMAAFSVALLVFVTRYSAYPQIQRDAGYSLLFFARDAARQLDYEIYRHADLLRTYSQLALRSDRVNLPRKLDALRQAQSAYDWVGLVDRNGQLLATSGKLPEDDPLLSNLQFYAELPQVYISEGRTLSAPDAETCPGLALLIASPLEGRSGTLIVRLNSQWSSRILNDALAAARSVYEIELDLFDSLGRQIYPTCDVSAGRQLDESEVPQFVRWSDGQDYLTVAVKSSGYRDYYGLGWTFVVRQPESHVLAFMHQLRWTILGAALGVVALSGLLGWWLSRRISRPLRDLTQAAETLDAGESIGIPDPRAYREANVLSRTLSNLLGRLVQEKHKLAELNANLEEQVEQRTRMLVQSNEQLLNTLSERQTLIAQLETLVRTDALTGLANRRAFFERAEAELRRHQRHDAPLSLIAIDIDHFKKINDRYGHEGGDQVLRLFAQESLRQLRDVDLLARLGGEEFLLLLPDTAQSGALMVAERLRMALAVLDVPVGTQAARFTASFGVAGAVAGETLDVWMGRADSALYRAKSEGRNRVRVWEGPGKGREVDRRGSEQES